MHIRAVYVYSLISILSWNHEGGRARTYLDSCVSGCARQNRRFPGLSPARRSTQSVLGSPGPFSTAYPPLSTVPACSGECLVERMLQRNSMGEARLVPSFVASEYPADPGL